MEKSDFFFFGPIPILDSTLSNYKTSQFSPRSNVFFLKLFLFLIGIYYMQGQTSTTRNEVTRKRSTERLKHTGKLFRKNL